MLDIENNGLQDAEVEAQIDKVYEALAAREARERERLADEQARERQRLEDEALQQRIGVKERLLNGGFKRDHRKCWCRPCVRAAMLLKAPDMSACLGSPNRK